MEESSISFHGNGDRAVPAAPPITNDKKLLRSTFIDYPSPYPNQKLKSLSGV
jgi:hypothetical protein